MAQSKLNVSKELIHCNLCNRPILLHDIDNESNIAYCYGCNYYFPLGLQSVNPRDEIVIPLATSFIRLRILRDELTIIIKWNRNFQLLNALYSPDRIFPKPFIAFAKLFNRTKIVIQSDFIKIDHGPVDILPMVFYSSKKIRQVFVAPLELDAHQTSRFGLYLQLSSGNHELIMWDLKKTTLLFIEQEIERVLKIRDTL
jgi:hypothetical protein